MSERGEYIGSPIAADPSATVTIPYKHYRELLSDSKILRKKLVQLSRQISATKEPTIKMIDYGGEGMVPAELCTIDREGGADDFVGCGYCFDGTPEDAGSDCENCVVNKIFRDYARLTGQETTRSKADKQL